MIVRHGFFVVALFFGTLTILAIFGELSGAVVSPGRVVVDSYSKKVQHLEGGIVESILVKEGERVEAGQTLIALQSITADASMDLYKKALAAYLATRSRLLVEKDFGEFVSWPKDLLALVEEYGLEDILHRETNLFASQLAAEMVTRRQCPHACLP